eukprot:14131416-Ditylum_brightwellii.AAC.1
MMGDKEDKYDYSDPMKYALKMFNNTHALGKQKTKEEDTPRRNPRPTQKEPRENDISSSKPNRGRSGVREFPAWRLKNPNNKMTM